MNESPLSKACDNLFSQANKKPHSVYLKHKPISTHKLILDHLFRKSICKEFKQWNKTICDFNAFKAFFNSNISEKIYDHLEPKGMYFKAQDITVKWVEPILKGDFGIYMGEFLDWKTPHGSGVEIILHSPANPSLSSIYEGSWNHAKYHGKGRLTTSSGIFYFGDWINGEKHGIGVVNYISGWCYEGEWKNDEYHGFGHSWNSQGEHWEGQFQSGYPHGLVRYWDNTSAYYGYFKNGERHGNGWIIVSDGNQYIGGFANNKANGKGSFRYPNGGYYKGSIVNNKKSGYGTLFDKNIGIYKGQFEDGKATGSFLLIKNSGETQKLIAIGGHFIGIMDEILKNLYLGSAEAAKDLEELKSKGIRNIVRVLDDEDVPMYPELNYYIIQAKDSKRENISKYFYDAIKFIHAALLSNEKVLIHCYQGVSRSSTIVLAYIMASHKCDLESALKLAREKRKIVFPNSGFIKQLNEFDFNRISL